MKALVYTAPRRVEVQPWPDPAPKPGEVLLKISSAGLCGSDLHGFLGHSPRRQPGLVMGHETVATVLEVGRDVKGWAPGRRVSFNPLVSCGACPACQDGRQNLCCSWWLFGMDKVQGTFAEYVSVPACQLLPLSEALPEKAAILAEPLAVVVHFFRISMEGTPARMAIWGAGTIGSLALVLAKLRGIPQVAVIDQNDARLAVAKRLGADLVIHSGRTDAQAALREWSRGFGADYVAECVGVEATRRAAVASARKGARLLFIGMAHNDSPLPWIDMIRNEQAVFTSFGYTPKDFQTSIELLEARKLDLAAWTEARPLEEGQAAFTKMADAPGDTLKLMFQV
jgi:threonine dehydrogenase-like Zn-dependent dehydrogenase